VQQALIVDSDGCGVRGSYSEEELCGCGGPIRTAYTIFDHTVPERIDPRGLLVTQRNERVNLGRVLCGNRCRGKGTGGQNYGS
jgi:hypothetical protein